MSAGNGIIGHRGGREAPAWRRTDRPGHKSIIAALRLLYHAPPHNTKGICKFWRENYESSPGLDNWAEILYDTNIAKKCSDREDFPWAGCREPLSGGKRPLPWECSPWSSRLNGSVPSRAGRFSTVRGIGLQSRMRGRAAPRRVVPRKRMLSSLAARQGAEAFFMEQSFRPGSGPERRG